MLVDSHCHLDRIKLDPYNGNLDAAIDAAKAAGVSHLLCVCISEENKNEVVEIANRFDGVFSSVGIHPSDVKDGDVVSVDTLCQWSKDKTVVAIGETGLDYYYTDEFADKQKQSFENHLVAAGDLGLPVIVHTRDARKDTIEMIRSYGCLESAGVLHCFTESWEMAKQALDLNYYISISGIVTFKSAEELRSVAKQVPLDKILVETDSPYLAPVPYRGKSNEPRYAREVAEFVAELRGLSFEEFAQITSDNFFRLFNSAKP